jgi:4'-phosphopantetheinyl transferase
LSRRTERALIDMLDESERAVHREIAPSRRSGWLAGRAVARASLARLAGVPPAELKLIRPRWAKPRLDPRHRLSTSIDFSLAHAPRLVMMGVSSNGPIGVDVERVDAVRAVGGRRALDDRELEALAHVAPADQTAECLRVWTVKEACVKAAGVALRNVRSVHVSPGSQGVWRSWRWQTVDLGEATAAAVATHASAPEANAVVGRFELDAWLRAI